MTGGGTEDAFSFRCFLGGADVYLKAKFGEGFVDQLRADFKIIS